MLLTISKDVVGCNHLISMCLWSKRTESHMQEVNQWSQRRKYIVLTRIRVLIVMGIVACTCYTDKSMKMWRTWKRKIQERNNRCHEERKWRGNRTTWPTWRALYLPRFLHLHLSSFDAERWSKAWWKTQAYGVGHASWHNALPCPWADWTSPGGHLSSQSIICRRGRENDKSDVNTKHHRITVLQWLATYLHNAGEYLEGKRRSRLGKK